MDPLLEQFNTSLYRSNVALYNGDGQDIIQYIHGYYQNPQNGYVVGLSNLGSGEYIGEMSVSGGHLKSTNFKSGTIGWEFRSDGTIEAVNATLSGVITATSGTIGGWTVGATSLTTGSSGTTVGLDNTITGGDDVRIYAGSATPASAPFRVTESGALTTSNITITGGSLNINNKAIIGSDGLATFIGVSTLNLKTYSSFETAARFGTSVGGTGAQTWGSGGLFNQTGAGATSYAVANFVVGYYAFSGSPTYTCTVLLNGIALASGVGQAFFGIGSMVTAGTGLTFDGGNSCCGFYLNKTGGVCTLYAKQSNGTNTATSSALTTVADGDFFDLIIKINGTSSVDYYYRKNGAALTGPTSLSTYVPTDAAENECIYTTSNVSTAFDFDFNIFSTSYER